MKSRSKCELDEKTIIKVFEHAGIFGAKKIAPLGAGEFNSVYSVDAGGKKYAIKVAPEQDRNILTYEKDMIEQEVYHYGLMKKAGINVPEIFYTDFSRHDIPPKFFIMERLNGRQLDKAKLTKTEKTEAKKLLVEMVAKMHSVKGEKFGYMQCGLYDTWYLAIRAFVENLVKDCKAFGKTTKNGERLLVYIERNKKALENAESRLVNFDIWPPNIFVEKKDGHLKMSWIDPERCFCGDSIADFVCLDFMKMSMDKKSEILKIYNAAADKPVVVNDETRIRYATMLCYLGLIMEVEKYSRYTPRHFGWWRNIFASRKLFSTGFKTLKRYGR